MIRSLLFWCLFILCASGVTHIVTILASTRLAPQSVYERLYALLDNPYLSNVHDGDKQKKLIFQMDDQKKAEAIDFVYPYQDPFATELLCFFDVRERPFHLEAEINLPLWSLAVFDPEGRIIHDMSDGVAIENYLDLILIAEDDRQLVAQDQIRLLPETIISELPVPEGFLILRAFTPDSFQRDAAIKVLNAVSCKNAQIIEAFAAPTQNQSEEDDDAAEAEAEVPSRRPNVARPQIIRVNP